MAGHKKFPLQGCKEYENDLILFYYGELEGDESSRVEAHLRKCVACRQSIESMRSLLPRTVTEDHPPQSFWDDYSREMRIKLDQVDTRVTWWDWLLALVRPWPVPAVATAFVLILALTLTLNRTLWRPAPPLPSNEEVIEILRIADDVEFFKNLDLLDSMDVLEGVGPFSNGQESA
ncbi:MAG: hypothetical protein GTO40_26905 [Deltaproteobacteria bacterium]|nr:hypothetical protein [Deltaproteobacteria bacterium]